MDYTKGNLGALGKWETSGNAEVIGIKDVATSQPIAYMKPANWEVAHLIAAAPDLYEVLHRAFTDPEYVLSGEWYMPAKQALAKAGDKVEC